MWAFPCVFFLFMPLSSPISIPRFLLWMEIISGETVTILQDEATNIWRWKLKTVKLSERAWAPNTSVGQLNQHQLHIQTVTRSIIIPIPIWQTRKLRLRVSKQCAKISATKGLSEHSKPSLLIPETQPPWHTPLQLEAILGLESPHLEGLLSTLWPNSFPFIDKWLNVGPRSYWLAPPKVLGLNSDSPPRVLYITSRFTVPRACFPEENKRL